MNPTQQSILNRASFDKFLLVLNLPDIFKALNPSLKIDTVEMSVYGTVVPDITVPSIELPFGGQTYNISSHVRPNYQPLNVNVIVDNKFTNYWILWKWLTILNNPKTGLYDGTPTPVSLDGKLPTNPNKNVLMEYQSNFSIYGLDEYNKKIVEFVYYNAFITNLGSINYNYRTSDIIETVAQFQFSQFDVKLLT
jgi:hypothetical protein